MGKLFVMRSLKCEGKGFRELRASSSRRSEFRAELMARGSVARVVLEPGADGSDGPSWPCNLCICGRENLLYK